METIRFCPKCYNKMAIQVCEKDLLWGVYYLCEHCYCKTEPEWDEE